MKSLGESYGPGPAQRGSARSPRASVLQIPPPPPLLSNDRVLQGPPEVPTNICISLFILRFMRLPCTLGRARIIIPPLQTGWGGDSAHLLLLSLAKWGDAQAS